MKTARYTQLRQIFVPMTPDNQDKIIKGTKTTTTRGKGTAEKIGLFVDESGLTTFKGIDFVITNRGPQSIEQAGGKMKMEKSEDFGSDGPMFQQTRSWLEGKGPKLYVYDFKRLQQ